MKKFLVIAASLIVIIGIALTVFIKVYVTPEKVKEYVIPAAEKLLNRKVSIGEIDINILKGIGLKDFTIKEADQTTDFLKCKVFALKFQLISLLSGKVIIDKLIVESPYIRIERSNEGKYNFDDIVKRKAPGEPIQEKEDEAVETPPISLLVSKISIRDAKVSLTDLKKELPDFISTTDIEIRMKSGAGSEIFSEGSIEINLDEAVLRKPAVKRIRNISSRLQYAVRVDPASYGVHIEKAEIDIRNISASIKGDIKDLNTSPLIDIAVSLPKTDTANIQTLLAPFVQVEGLSLSGFLAAELTVKGRAKKPELMKAKGNISLEKLGISYNGINASLNGKIILDDTTMKIDLTGSSGRNTASLKGSVSSLFADQDIALNVYAKKLYLDELIPGKEQAATPTPAEIKPAGTEPSAVKEGEPLKLKLTAKGEVRIDSAVYKGMDMTDFVMKYRFKDNKLTISKMTANAGKGRFNLKSSIDFSRPGYAYTLTSRIDSLHAEEIVNAFVPKAKNKVFGIITSTLTLRGSGTLPGSIKKNLSGDADFNVKDGKISDAEIAKKLSLFVNISELETIEFTKADGTVKIGNSVAKLNSLFTSKDLAMDPKGNIGLDETLDLAFDLKLSPRLTDQAISSSISKYMSDEGGWGTIPILVTGTFSNPKYRPDIAKAGTQVIEKEVNKLLDTFLNKGGYKESPRQQKEERTSPEPVNPVEDLLKQLPGLFNN